MTEEEYVLVADLARVRMAISALGACSRCGRFAACLDELMKLSGELEHDITRLIETSEISPQS